MFFRRKKVGDRVYLQIVENRWENGRSKQRVIATLGRLDRLRETGELDGLLQSGARLSESVMVLTAHRQGAAPAVRTEHIGPALIFERLWEQLQIGPVVTRLLCRRRFSIPIERIVFLTVLHRLFVSGSDRACFLRWMQDHPVRDTETISLHQVYRSMAWLGSPLPEENQQDATPFSVRCVKDVIEEMIFERRRDLFAKLDLVFFDTTSIYFEGDGGTELGQYGKSKDHRPDRKQMIVGAVLDGEGRPLCCELWPGNVTDVRTLIPVVDRLQKRFRIGSICIVADRGMISRETIDKLQDRARNVHYILGARLRNVKEIRETVLSRGGRYCEVHPERQKSSDPSPLKVKEVRVDDRRYIVCLNEAQARKDRMDREAIIKSLCEQLKRGDKSLVGNKGYRKYLRSCGKKFQIDRERVKREARFDGKWVLQTNREDLSSAEVALKYKQLWMVEQMFRSAKSLLDTRPIYHHCDETIRGHVFCSFLALMMRKELQDRLAAEGKSYEWEEILRDLEALQYTDVVMKDRRFRLRSEVQGSCADVFKIVGVAIPPTVQRIAE